MHKQTANDKYNPYHRFYAASDRLKNDTGIVESADKWEDKLYTILKIRKEFIRKYGLSYMREFRKSYPLYATLLEIFEEDRPGSTKELLEAALLATPNCSAVAAFMGDARIDSLFVSCYRELFYNVINLTGNPVQEFIQIIAPMLKMNSNKIAIGAIWKLLALTGGLDLLKKKGIEASPISGGDIQQLLQLASMRHCSMLLQYSSDGMAFFEDNPAAAAIMTSLSELSTIRGFGRGPDRLAEVKDIIVNNFERILDGELSLISAPTDSVKELVSLDGVFHPELESTNEKTEHKTYNVEDVD